MHPTSVRRTGKGAPSGCAGRKGAQRGHGVARKCAILLADEKDLRRPVDFDLRHSTFNDLTSAGSTTQNTFASGSWL